MSAALGKLFGQGGAEGLMGNQQQSSIAGANSVMQDGELGTNSVLAPGQTTGFSGNPKPVAPNKKGGAGPDPLAAMGQYQDMSGASSIGGLMNMQAPVQQPQMRQQNPMQVDEFLQSLMR